MAEPVDVDLEARVAALVEARRDQLHELVRQAVDRELERLVDAELRSRNGAGDTPRAILDARNGHVTGSHVGATERKQTHRARREAGDPSSEIESPALALRRCNRCERDLPASSFERHRNVCRECRRQEARDREHRAEPAVEPPRPGPTV